MNCELCDNPGSDILWQDTLCRVVLVDNADYPGFCRVILNRHIKEMTDLPPPEQHQLMAAVYATEAALREILHPDKINLASLGNVVPHVHWHVIPRFVDDPHFPNPIWGEMKRNSAAREVPGNLAVLLRAALTARLG
ncbi:MAG: HIT family protein [Methylobacillus sp.]|jgi:diadenosine tetraphosphate (Ap4A) HIT family hydrolase|nr:HIT family protein [Methylobacillus sp.]